MLAGDLGRLHVACKAIAQNLVPEQRVRAVPFEVLRGQVQLLGFDKFCVEQTQTDTVQNRAGRERLKAVSGKIQPLAQ